MALSWWPSPGSSFVRGRCRRLFWPMWIAAGVGSEHLVPHSLNVSSQLGQTFLRGTVIASSPFPAIAHEPRSAQHAKVLGNTGLPDLRDAGELADRVRTPAQTLEQCTPGRIGKRHHHHSIGHALYRHTRMDKSIMISWQGATTAPKITELVLTWDGGGVPTRACRARPPRTSAARACPSGT